MAGAALWMVLAAAAATAITAAALLERLAEAGLTRLNYRGRPVVTGIGVALLAGPLAALAVGGLGQGAGFNPGMNGNGAAASAGGQVGLAGVAGWPGPDAALVAAVGMAALVGLLDDLLDEPVRGWRGHGVQAVRGRWTGGHLKLLMLVLGAWALIPAANLPARLLGAGLAAASANACNLLDRRPGRCLKSFLVAWLVLGAVLPGAARSLWPLAVAAVVLLPLDLAERSMLGDAGSNALGMGLGWVLAVHLPPASQGIALGALMAFHILGELVSLSRCIEAMPLLRWWDRLGVGG